MMLGEYGLFSPEPEAVDDALIVAFVAWCVAGVVAIYLWATRQRYAFTTSLGWAAFAWILVIAVIAASPAPAEQCSWAC